MLDNEISSMSYVSYKPSFPQHDPNADPMQVTALVKAVPHLPSVEIANVGAAESKHKIEVWEDNSVEHTFH